MALHKRHEMSSLEQVSLDPFTHILEYVNVVDRVKLARSSKALQKRVYQECRDAWTRIDFYAHGISSTVREQLTDHSLSELLVRVNAKEITRYLNLLECTAVRGPGLMCLRNSQVLQHVGLVETGADENPAPFLSILRTVVPFRLCSVQVSAALMRNPSDAVVEFFRSLREVKLEQAISRRTLCDSCNLPVAESSRLIIPNSFGVSLFHCILCNKSLCKRTSCPLGLLECQACGVSHCSECNVSAQCYSCGRTYCCDCATAFYCGQCDKSYCNKCDVYYDQETFYCANASCRNIICKACAKSPETCSNECLLCQKCIELGSCFHCKESYCVICEEHKSQCQVCCKNYCGKRTCRAMGNACGGCKHVFCIECKEMEHCRTCNKDFCKDHNRLVDCKACGTCHCRPCGHEACALCAALCFDGCVCNKIKPTKRARLS